MGVGRDGFARCWTLSVCHRRSSASDSPTSFRAVSVSGSGLARALAADPEILLFDEPFGALDAITRSRLQKEFAELVRSLRKTVVFVTHDLYEAMRLADRIALMERGKIVLVDEPESFSKSDLPLARAYLDTVMISHL
jgi:ABC-type sulfate/molybdate transport systems ATPase subunit